MRHGEVEDEVPAPSGVLQVVEDLHVPALRYDSYRARLGTKLLTERLVRSTPMEGGAHGPGQMEGGARVIVTRL